MKKDIFELLWKPYNAEILNLSDGKNNISDIHKKIPLTYKSVFFRLKELEEAGILEKSEIAPHLTKSPTISEEYKKEVNRNITWIISNQENLEKEIKNPDKKKAILEILKLLRGQRKLDRKEFLNKIRHLSPMEYLQMFNLLRNSVFVKERLEITKKGIKFLKENEHKNPSV